MEDFEKDLEEEDYEKLRDCARDLFCETHEVHISEEDKEKLLDCSADVVDVLSRIVGSALHRGQ